MRGLHIVLYIHLHVIHPTTIYSQKGVAHCSKSTPNLKFLSDIHDVRTIAMHVDGSHTDYAKCKHFNNGTCVHTYVRRVLTVLTSYVHTNIHTYILTYVCTYIQYIGMHINSVKFFTLCCSRYNTSTYRECHFTPSRW